MGAYEKAVELRPEVSDSYYNLGLCYLSANKSKKAIHCFQEALKRNSQDADSSFYLAIAHIDLKDEYKAIEVLHQTLVIDLEHEKSHYLLGRLHYLRVWEEKEPESLSILISKNLL